MKRKPTSKELQLIKFLVQRADMIWEPEWDDSLLVEPMNDGGMGSLTLFPDQKSFDVKRIFGRQVADCQFTDNDGIVVLPALYLDEQGNLYELDIWKTDFAPLIDFPDHYENIHKRV